MKFRMPKFTIVFSIAALSLVFIACTNKHQEPSKTVFQNTSEKAATYIYPHPTEWKNQHVEFYAKYGKNIQGSQQDCSRCHSQTQHVGTPKNLACATQCHTPVTVPGGSNPTENPPISDSGKVCMNCHLSNFTRKKQHYPAATGLCTTCHTISPEHLTEKSKKSVTTNNTNQNCLSCHDKKDSHKFIHGALSMNNTSCTYCHDAHGSEHNYFTTDKIETLCTDCHSNIIGDDVKSVHGIIKAKDENKKSCTNCHNPHSSDIKTLLVKEKGELCISCHDREYKTTFANGDPRTIPNIKQKIKGPNAHPGAKNENNCTICHSPHASQYNYLLKLNYQTKPYSKYSPSKDNSPDSYELCFKCHDSTMLNKDVTEDDTNFRNDTKSAEGNIDRKNLHWFHVVNATDFQNKDLGRSCFACHDPHGSEQNHSIKTSFKLNNVDIKIVYKATKTGGECTYTCHSDSIKKYNREN